MYIGRMSTGRWPCCLGWGLRFSSKVACLEGLGQLTLFKDDDPDGPVLSTHNIGLSGLTASVSSDDETCALCLVLHAPCSMLCARAPCPVHSLVSRRWMMTMVVMVVTVVTVMVMIMMYIINRRKGAQAQSGKWQTKRDSVQTFGTNGGDGESLSGSIRSQESSLVRVDPCLDRDRRLYLDWYKWQVRLICLVRLVRLVRLVCRVNPWYVHRCADVPNVYLDTSVRGT